MMDGWTDWQKEGMNHLIIILRGNVNEEWTIKQCLLQTAICQELSIVNVRAMKSIIFNNSDSRSTY